MVSRDKTTAAFWEVASIRLVEVNLSKTVVNSSLQYEKAFDSTTYMHIKF